jgi:hypothetical protein
MKEQGGGGKRVQNLRRWYNCKKFVDTVGSREEMEE